MHDKLFMMQDVHVCFSPSVIVQLIVITDSICTF